MGEFEQNKILWVAVFRLEREICPTFKDAVKSLWKRVKTTECLTHFDIGETMWIENNQGDLPIRFFVARDIAAEQGWFDEFEKELENGDCENHSPANTG